MSLPELPRRIQLLIENGTDSFDRLAAEVISYQIEHIEPYRRLCRARSYDPESGCWRQAPAVPTSAFKRLRLCAAQPQAVFRSSGTTRGQVRSQHHHPFLDLYRTVIEASFPAACLPSFPAACLPTSPAACLPTFPAAGLPSGRVSAERVPEEVPAKITVPILSLIPSAALVPDSSLSFMAEHVLERYGAAGSRWAVGSDGIDAESALDFLDQHRSGAPVLVLTTALALLFLIEELERRGLELRLPQASRLFETGGFKGSTRAISRDELLDRAERALGIPPDQVVREYGMTELTSQAYSRPGGELLQPPPWMRVRVLDPIHLEDTEPGREGLLSVFDLANVGSAAAVLTEDLGRLEEDADEGSGFRLLGRASGAELRGCSLTVEELTLSS